VEIALQNALSGLSHQPQVKTQILNTGDDRTHHFIGLKQMSNIGFAILRRKQ
jgi:hypothetical protein